MTPADLARLHALCFTAPPPWNAASFSELLSSPHVFLLIAPGAHAFALVRVVAPEAELLTLATDPAARRQGLASGLVARVEAEARSRGAETLFLEVAEDNTPARALYSLCGFTCTGRRPGYYRPPEGQPVAALLLCKSIG
ncbi:MAG: GNAT family N-acetyltransferase [Pararhodobacter sp.]|nr:GNAT family N-acetyltransferase [Pararhodobacter sp.]